MHFSPWIRPETFKPIESTPLGFLHPALGSPVGPFLPGPLDEFTHLAVAGA
jgi:hypothetical protein